MNTPITKTQLHTELASLKSEIKGDIDTRMGQLAEALKENSDHTTKSLDKVTENIITLTIQIKQNANSNERVSEIVSEHKAEMKEVVQELKQEYKDLKEELTKSRIQSAAQAVKLSIIGVVCVIVGGGIMTAILA